MESRDWWADAGYDGESKQEKCRSAEQMDGVWWAGNCPSLYPEMCCPINVARGLFSCCNKNCIADTIVKEGKAFSAGVLAWSLSICLHWERQEQQASELPLYDAMISSLMMLLRASLFSSGCSLQHRLLFSLVKFIVNLITLTICKVAVWSVCCNTSREWMGWMGATEIRFECIITTASCTKTSINGQKIFLIRVQSSDTDSAQLCRVSNALY